MIETTALVDQNCHGVLRTELGIGTFETRLGRTSGPPAAGACPPDGRCDPAPVTGFAEATAGRGTDLVLLHGCPYHHHAAHLTGAFPHVYADLGPALAHTGARAATVLAEVLELAPFGKLLFSSGARGLPELHVVGAGTFRESPARVLGGWAADGSWSAADARRVAAMIAAGNAHRVYGLAAF